MSPNPTRYRVLTDPAAALPFHGMTYPAHRGLLAAVGPGGPVVAVAADADGRPAGLALAQVHDDGHTAEVLSIYTAPEFRGAGVGTALLAEVEGELGRRGVAEMVAVYPGGRPATPAVERLLARRGWPAATPRMELVTLNRSSLETARVAPWFRQPAWPADCEVFPWAELTAREREELRAAEWYPPILSPFNEPERIEPLNSLGLRYRGSVAGWMLTHRIAAETLRYTSLFVRPEVPAKGVGFAMVVEAVRRHLASPGEDRFAVFGVHAVNPLIGFLRRRVLPHLGVESVVTTMESRKRLGHEGEPAA
jgi:GNAT superfamily N-acetyltransferase